MKFFEKIKLAFYNLIKRFKTTAQCVTMMCFIMLLIFISAFFITTLVIGLKDSLDNYASKNYITIRHTSYEDYMQVDNVLLNPSMQSELKVKFNSVGDINYYKFAGTPYVLSITNLIIDGEVFPFNNLSEKYFSVETVIKEISVPTFSDNMQTEFSKKFPGEKLIKYGRDIQNTGEILFPEELLILYGITPEQLLLSDKVSLWFYYVDHEYDYEIDEMLFYDAKVVGITNANITMMYPDKDGNRDPCSVIYAESNVLFDSASFDTYQRIELNDSSEINEIIKYLEDFFGEDYWISYGNQAKLNELDAINKILIFVRDIIIVLFFVLGVALAVFLYSVMEFSAKQKGSYYGIIRAMGKSGIFDITLLETVIMTVVAAVICLALSIITMHFLSGTVISIAWTISYTLNADSGIFALVFILTLTAVILLNILLAFLSSRRQISKTITEALRS